MSVRNIRRSAAAGWRSARRSRPLRWLLAAAAVRLAIGLIGPAVRSSALADLVETAADLVIAAVAGYLLLHVFVRLLRRLLWRVRRKLVLSYVFIGLTPIVLIVSLLLLTGILTLLSVSSYLVKLSLDDLAHEAGVVAEAAAGELNGVPTAAADVVLARHRQALAARCLAAGVGLLDAQASGGAAAGRWLVSPPASRLPRWLAGGTFQGLVTLRTPDGMRLVARAVRPVDRRPARVVVVDLAIDADIAARIRRDTGAVVRRGAVVEFDAAGRPAAGEAVVALATDEPATFVSARGLAWFTLIEHTSWESGEKRLLRLGVRVPPLALYQRVFGAQARIGEVEFGYLLLVALAAVTGLFLVLEIVALVMGLALARSITGAVHALFVGTNQVRRGDLDHRIRVRTRDQLGELADSFNAMTASVRDLLQQVAAKRRLEEELRIAREVQMSLLPRNTVAIPGLGIATECIPAREVGGDYYDFIRLGERRLGVLVADVSGKGASAAFYMAELKGLVLSLARIHESPRQLLIEINRIAAGTLDARSFITMMYAVIDLDRRLLTFARAGHTPLIHLACDSGASGVRVLAPDGLVAGLDGFERQFDELLEEDTLAIGPGDMMALFTDGITEAMNADDEQFGEERLSRLLEQHRDASLDALGKQVLDSIGGFVGGAAQHDDMTIVLLRVDGGAAG